MEHPWQEGKPPRGEWLEVLLEEDELFEPSVFVAQARYKDSDNTWTWVSPHGQSYHHRFFKKWRKIFRPTIWEVLSKS